MVLRPSYILCALLVTWSNVFGQDKPVMNVHEGSVQILCDCLNDTSSEQLKVFTAGSLRKNIRQPISGRYSHEQGKLVFTPHFAFSAGEEYVVEFGRDTFHFEVPESETKPAFVSAFYPSADTLPENLLRMYVTFSAPMSPGGVYDHVLLYDAGGTLIEKPFLVVDQELWNSDRTRLTILFDPGRIKRGILSNVEMGLALKAGQSYRLVITEGLQDEAGNVTEGKFEKRFVAGHARRDKLKTDDWIVNLPKRSNDPLAIDFRQPIDHVLAEKFMAVISESGEVIQGKTSFDDGDRHWEFHPSNPWKDGNYKIEISTLLEDVAGNNLNNAFDVDLHKGGRTTSAPSAYFNFSVPGKAPMAH